MNIFTSASQLVGRTPLLELRGIEKELGLEAKIYAKLEYFNPAGSVKDRVALYMINDAEERGILKEGSVIIEPTSGNTGIGLASVAASRGYRTIIVMPETMSVERRQLMAAYQIKKPVIIHSREACQDTIDILKSNHANELGGIIHCYSYSKEAARDYLNMGFHIGIGGVVTFKNARKLVEAVEYIPLDRIVLETDCPYMAPEPHRGKRNDSRNLQYVAAKIGEIKGISPQEVIDATNYNARKLFIS